MRSLPLVVAVLCSCQSVKEEVKPDELAAAPAPADAGFSRQKLLDAAALGKKAADYPMSAPATRTQIVEEVHFGAKVSDPYRWLEDEKSPEVQAWMAAQDKFARDHLAALPMREALRKRYTDLYYLESIGAPVKKAGRWFYRRTHKDKEKSIIYWRASEKAPEQVLLDPNAWSTDNTVSLGGWWPSEDGKKVVFAEKPNAADEATLYVLDVDKGERSKVDVIPGAKYASPSWLPDSKGFYYEWLPVDPKIPVSERPGYTEIRFHALGTDPAKDPVVHEKTGDPKTFLGGGVSRDGKYLLASIARGWNENDVYFQVRGAKGATWKLLAKGADAKFDVLVWKDVFYVVTDDGAPNKQVFKVDPRKPERAAWKVLVPEDKDAAISSVTLVGGHLCIERLRKAVTELSLYALDGKKVRNVELPGLGTASNLVGDEDDDDAFYAFSSFVMPNQVFRTSVKTGKSEVWFKVEVPVDPSPFVVDQVTYTSKDGTPVSMFLVHRKDLQKNGENPTLLYGYGGFDISLTSSFNSFIYPWLEAGGMYAVPNLRGGGEYGKAWHDSGRGAKKQNVFDDFAGAAEYLIREKYTSPEKLGIRGGSNGGLLVGAAMTQRPELYGAVICAVPLLDMLRYHLFGSGKTWIAEYGDPEVQADHEVLKAYSPYHHVKERGTYPPLLMMSADHDDRVDPMHARKFVGMVQGATKGQSPVWLRIEAHAGHGGADQVAKSIESSADQIAFLMSALKVSPRP